MCLIFSLGVPCPPLPKIDNALLQDDIRTYQYPETLNVTCKTGYEVVSSDLLQCNSSGFWSYIPQCSCKDGASKDLPEFSDDRCLEFISQIVVSEQDVLDILSTLGVNKAVGPDTCINSNTELTFDEVKEKLRKQGIRAPSTFTKEQLLELLNENSGQDNTVMPEIPALTQLTTSLNNMEQTVQNQGTLIQSLLVRESNSISQPAVVSDINNGVHHDTGSYHTTKVSSGMFPHVQAVALNVRKQILEGKYINLATFLNQENVQDYKTVDESDGSVLLIKHRDPRLQRNLSIQEFLEAFNIYKNIICEKQDRRIEFDMYIQDVIDISARYKGPVFYEYHKAFANKVAAIKLTHGKVVDWSIRDEKLYSSITSGQIIKECETCGSLGHLTAVCQTLPSFGQSNNRSKPTYNQTHFQKSQVGSNDRVDSNTDIRGRPVLFSWSGNKNFVFNLINGLRYGFDTGINVLPSKSLECKNLLSTKKFPDDVTKLVDDELRKGYLIGPFTKPPFDTYRISPIGIVEGKYSKKKRLILDLSASHNNDEHHSINDLINKEDYSLTYVRIDDAIKLLSH
ncbi:unnamed protein product [Mytilus edulis]|uniref:Sushi domain-containing protein n=1 Tax=Mytilus edulis TaxID=6550 RepID=A0A8S3VQX5_MYTED|nr:unnamed protein product [Mytilus edulis]